MPIVTSETILVCIAVFSPKDKESRKPRGFTFCQYKKKEDAEDAVKGMNNRVKSVLVQGTIFLWCALIGVFYRLIKLFNFIGGVVKI